MTTPYEAWTPVQCEAKLSELMNSVAQAEIAMRQCAERELHAKLQLERDHLIASTDPMCPVPMRGGATVAERDDWIRGQEIDAYEHHERMKLELKTQQRYQERLEQQVSMVQTMAKLVMQAYNVMGAGR